MVRRRRLSSTPLTGPLQLVVGDHPVIPGDDLLDVFVDTDDERSAELVRQWVVLLDAAILRSPDDRPPLDLVPHNLVVDPAGTVHFIDDEWRGDVATRDLVLQRGCLYIGISIAEGGRPRGAWAGCREVRDAVVAVGRLVGLPADGSWLATAIDAEAGLQAAVTTWHGGRSELVVDALNEKMNRDLHSPVDVIPRLRDLRDRLALAESRSLELADELTAAERTIADQARRLTALEIEADVLQERERRAWAQLELMRRTITWRLTAPLRPGRRSPADGLRTSRRVG